MNLRIKVADVHLVEVQNLAQLGQCWANSTFTLVVRWRRFVAKLQTSNGFEVDIIEGKEF